MLKEKKNSKLKERKDILSFKRGEMSWDLFSAPWAYYQTAFW